jgi:anti-sigma regulatory factor (Ser/Thr protein kinase)
MSPSLSLRLDAVLEDLPQIRCFVQESASALGIASGDVPNVVLAVDEAVTNIILHSYAGHGGPVEIEVTKRLGALVVRLRDKAQPFDPTCVPAPDLTDPVEKRTLGGLGVHLIRQVMDQLIYRRRVDGGNELTMIKRVP